MSRENYRRKPERDHSGLVIVTLGVLAVILLLALAVPWVTSGIHHIEHVLTPPTTGDAHGNAE